MIRIVRSTADSRRDWSDLILVPPQGRPPMTQEINTLPQSARLDLLCAARGREKRDLLLEACDAAELMALLPQQEFYLLLRELGVDDAVDILSLATTVQIVACLDLDGWKGGDELQPEAVREWLALLLECGEEKVLQTAREMDFELLALAMKTQFRIVRSPGDIDDEDLRQEAMRRNGGYEIEYFDPQQSDATTALLDMLLRLDHDFFRLLMESIRWEASVELEEEAYQRRCGRLLELGFPDPFVARAVYARLDPRHFAETAQKRRPTIDYGDEPLPAFSMLEVAPPTGLFAGILADGIDQATAVDLVMLLNKVIAADRVDLGDHEALRATAEDVYALLNLALEFLCDDDAVAASEMLKGYHPEEIFRLGFSLTLELQGRARRIFASPAAAFLDEPYAGAIDALLLPKPVFAVGIDRPGRTGERPFASHRDIRNAERYLDGVEAQLRFFAERAPFSLPTGDDYPSEGVSPARFEDVTFSTLLVTALSNRILGRNFAPTPIAQDDLPRLHAMVSRDGELDESLRRECRASMENYVSGIGPFCDWALDRWEEEFCAVDMEEFEPDYCERLIVRR